MRVLKGMKHPVTALAFSPDGRLLTSASKENVVRLWDGVTGAPGDILEVGQGSEFTLLFTPDSRQLVVATLCARASAWDVAGARRVKWFYETSEYAGEAGIAVTADGLLVITRTDRKSCICLYDPMGWVERAAWKPSVHGPGWTQIALEPGGNRAALGNGLLVDVRTGADLGRWHAPVEGYGCPGGRMMAWCPNKPLLAVGYQTKTIQIFDPVTAAAVTQLKSPSKYYEAFAFTPDGRHLIAVSNECVARIYDTSTWQARETLDWGIGPLKSIAVTADGTRAAAGGGGRTSGKIVIWDLD